MTGRELVEWIQSNHAEDLDCIFQYRDGGGSYSGGELVETPCIANYERDPDGHPYDVEIDYTYRKTHNCIVF